MATPTIPNGEKHFFPLIYEGNSAGQRIGKFVPFTDSGTIVNSAIFNRADSPNLNRTISSGSQRRIFTISCWVKLGVPASGTSGRHVFFEARQPSNSETCYFLLSDTGTLVFQSLNSGGSNVMTQMSNRTFEDTSKWYHFMVAVDTTQSTNTDKIKMYVDGDQITSLSYSNYDGGTNYDLPFGNDNSTMYVAEQSSSNYHLDGYLAEFNIVDGTALTPATFGLTNTSTGRWIPKTLTGITYGSNGARFQFESSSNLGDDTSGQNNDFTVANLVAGDQTTDSPTQNFATGTATADSGNLVPHTISEGNLTFNNPNGTSGRGFSTARSTLRLDPKSDTGYYCEVKVDTTAGGNGLGVGVTDVRVDGVQQSSSDGYFGAGNNFQLFQDSFYYREINGSGINATDASTFPAYTTGDTLGLAFKSGKLWIAKNNTWYNSGNPSTGANPLVELSNNTLYRFCLSLYGMNLSGAPKGTYNFGQKSLTYTAPTGFVSLNQDNMPTTDKGITGMAWIKGRDTTYNHLLIDSSRGGDKQIQPNLTNGELTQPDMIQKFLAGGYSVEDFVNLNTSGQSYVSWNWVANGGTTASNSDGSITSTVQVNTDAGFSIVQRTGTGSAGTVGHGLNKAPSWIFSKNLGTTESWPCWHQSIGAANAMFLNLNNASASSTQYNSTAPTSSVFSVGATDGNNQSSANHIDWVWCEVDGFSKFGKYVGNGSTDGTFVYTGFRPAWVMMKNSGTTGNWYIHDSTRDLGNPSTQTLMTNLANAEANQTTIDILSNGFKQRIGNDASNLSSNTYIYIAFAKHPFIGDGTSPVTAR